MKYRASILFTGLFVCAQAWGVAEIVQVQYRHPVEKEPHRVTAEVFVQNTNSEEIVLTRAEMDGATLFDLARHESNSWDGSYYTAYSNSVVPWAQIYPSFRIAPGALAVFQVNYNLPNRDHDQLVLSWKDGAQQTVDIAPFSKPDRWISAVTYWQTKLPPRDAALIKGYPVDYPRELNYELYFIAYQAPSTVVDAWVNGKQVKIIRAWNEPDGQGIVAVVSGKRMMDGTALCIDLKFADGKDRFASVRVFGGISRSIGPSWVGVRDVPRYLMNPYRSEKLSRRVMDPITGDSEYAAPGYHASFYPQERLYFYERTPYVRGLLLNQQARAADWDLYGGMMDFCQIYPNQHAYRHQDGSFLPAEEQHMLRASQAGEGRPWLWSVNCAPDRFGGLSPDEMSLMSWIALLRGAKAIQYNVGSDSAKEHLETPEMRVAVREMNADIIKLNQRLVSLIPWRTDETTLESNGQRLMVYRGLCGDRGALVLLRPIPAVGQVLPDNAVVITNNMPAGTVTFTPPGGMRPISAEDALSGSLLKFTNTTDRTTVWLDDWQKYRLIWLGNDDGGIDAN